MPLNPRPLSHPICSRLPRRYAADQLTWLVIQSTSGTASGLDAMALQDKLNECGECAATGIMRVPVVMRTLGQDKLSQCGGLCGRGALLCRRFRPSDLPGWGAVVHSAHGDSCP